MCAALDVISRIITVTVQLQTCKQSLLSGAVFESKKNASKKIGWGIERQRKWGIGTVPVQVVLVVDRDMHTTVLLFCTWIATGCHMPHRSRVQ